MPGWHAATKEARARGDVQLVGVIQEQHAERCRLFAQWQQLDWPILHDPFNLLELRAVPVPVAIDEHGIVRAVGVSQPQFASFLKTSFDAPTEPAPKLAAVRPDIERLVQHARGAKSSQAWRDVGDALLLWAGAERVHEAVDAYRAAEQLAPDDGSIQFRLGVAYRMRHDVAQRKPGDFQLAVDHWGRALESDPNHYIYRRRIQQYGPRLIKPYPFYDWVAQARQEIAARGDTPIKLSVEPSGAEIATPARSFAASLTPAKSPDPEGRINRDVNRLIDVSAVIVPAKIKAGESVRVHLRFRPTKSAHWNNESEPLQVWIDPPEGWTAESRLLSTPNPNEVESIEPRSIEFEMQSPPSTEGKAIVRAYALYYVCEERDGTCLYLRQDAEIPIDIKD